MLHSVQYRMHPPHYGRNSLPAGNTCYTLTAVSAPHISPGELLPSQFSNLSPRLLIVRHGNSQKSFTFYLYFFITIFPYNEIIYLIEIDNRWQLYEQGISVPGDISVAGFNDTSMCTLFSPSLISVRQDVALRARIALDALHRLNENKEMETTTMLPFTLVK